MSDPIRFTGLASGMDTESIIQQMVNIEQIKVDRVEQDKQYTEWQIEEYRNVINDIRGFKDEFFDVLNPDSNLRSSKSFNTYKVNYDGMDTSRYLDISANKVSDLQNKNITDIQTATSARVDGGKVAKGIEGNAIASLDVNDGTRFNMTLNGVTKEIEINHADELQTKINAAFGEGKVTVDTTDNEISFTTADTNTLKLSEVEGNIGLRNLGFYDDATSEYLNLSNKVELNKNISDIEGNFSNLLNIEGNVIEFKINGAELSYDAETTSINDIMKDINNKDLGVTMSYDEINDSFAIESNGTGYNTELVLEDTSSNFLSSITGVDMQSNPNVVHGSDASITFDDGTIIERPTNNFSVDGMTFNIKENYSDVNGMDISINNDTESAKETIVSFIEKYNEIVENISTKLSEKRDRDFRPLTDAQRDEMDDTEIERWEEKAKSGVLSRDNSLDSMLTQMRRALYEGVEGAGINLKDMGIETSSNWNDRGKLIIKDQDKLDKALSENSDKVVNLFTSSSDNYGEKGIANRLFDIIENNIATTGEKGTLIKKAGIEGDRTEFSNSLYDRVEDYDDRIADLMDNLASTEDYYYSMFARMEQAMNEMNQQSQWIAQQMGGGM